MTKYDSLTVNFMVDQRPSAKRLGPVGGAHFNDTKDLVVEVCARHGTVGPSGPTSRGSSVLLDDPDFYVVDDQYGDEGRICVEPKVSALSAQWLEELAVALREVPDWDVLVILAQGVSLTVAGMSVTIAGWVSESRDLADITRGLSEYLHAREAQQREGKQRRAADVSLLLPEAWRMSQGGALAFVAAFSTRSDGSAGDTVWILHFEDGSALDLDEYDFKPDAVRPSLYWADGTGQMIEYAPGVKPSGTYNALLAEWALEHEGKPVKAANRVRLSKGGRVWEFQLFSH